MVRRFGEKYEIEQTTMDAIAVFMDDEIREAIHYDMAEYFSDKFLGGTDEELNKFYASCKAENFLREYCRREPEFEDFLREEFSIELV